MAYQLNPRELEALKSSATAVALMKNDVKANVGKNGLKFVAAKNYKVGGKAISMFILTDKQADIVKILAKQPTATKSTGLCSVGKNGGYTQVNINSASGQISAVDVAKMVKVALGNDASFLGKPPAPATPPAAPPAPPAA